MSNIFTNKFKELVDLEIPNNLIEVLKGIQVVNSNLIISLQNSKKIIVTVHKNYSKFRNEIEKRLKDKLDDTNSAKHILQILDVIDQNVDVLFMENSIFEKEIYQPKIYQLQPDISDTSDSNKTKIVSISESIQLHSGQLRTRGTISSISEPYKLITSFTKSCEGCNSELKTILDIPAYSEPPQLTAFCPSCQIKLNIKYDYVNAISFELQDDQKYNDIVKLNCVLLEPIIDNIRVGEKVIATGTIKIIKKNYQKNGKLISVFFSDLIEYEKKEIPQLSDSDIEAIHRFSKLKGNGIIENLIDMFDPTVIGLDIVKQGLLYSLVSSGDDVDHIRTSRTRNRINVLLAGSPGEAKSTLLRKTVSLLQNSRYESCQHSSGKSLTAIVVKENEQYFLRIGAIPSSRGNVCALNELGLSSFDDQNHLLDIMEEGEFTINKYGIHSTIRSPTTIIASANTIEDKNAQLKHKINKKQIFLSAPLLDRFDIILVVLSNDDEGYLKYYVNERIKNNSNKVPNYDNYLRKYIEYARRIDPIVSRGAFSLLGNYFVALKKKDPSIGSKRILDTLLRISKSISRLKLREIVDTTEAKETITFYNEVITKYANNIASMPHDPTFLALTKCKQILQRSNKPLTIDALLKEVCENSEYLRTYILGNNDNYLNKKISIENNRKARKIYELLSDDDSVELINNKPKQFRYNQDKE